MKYLLVLCYLIGLPSFAHCKHLYSEKEYQNYWCSKHNGTLEFILNDKTRVDCITSNFAIEFDFAPKWAECIGQSQYYGIKTNRQPACVLIMENGEKDLKYLKRLRRVAYKKGIKTFTITPKVFQNVL